MIASFISSCLVVGLMLVSCLANSQQRVSVSDEFVVHDIQGWSPRSMVIDNQGQLWLVNTLAPNSVLQLNDKGKYVTNLKTRLQSNIAVIAYGGSDGLLYMADNLNRCIFLSTTDKIQIASYPYTLPRVLNVKYMTVDNQGTIYIIDQGSFSSQVWRMAADGSALPSIIPDPPIQPLCMAVDPNDVLYVADQLSNQILQFSRQGDQIGILASPLIHNIIGFVIDNKFNLYISSNGPSNKHQFVNPSIDPLPNNKSSPGTVTKLSADGTVLGSFQQSASLVAVDNEGSLFITDLFGHITKLNSDMQQVDQYQSDIPVAITAGVMPDPNGSGLITVNDLGNSLMRFHSNGSFKSSHPLALNELFVDTAVVGVDNQVYLYVMDGSDNIFIQLSENGTALTSVLLNDFEVVSFAVDADGNIYISTGEECNCVIVYSPAGEELRRLLPGPDPSTMFSVPSLIHVDANSSLYVLDYVQGMLYQLSATGELVWSFSFTDFTSYPIAFAVDALGDIYVTDVVESHFIHIRRSKDNSVVDYQLDDFDLFASSVVIGSDSTIFLSDSCSRILILTHMPSSDSDSSSKQHILLIVFASIGSLLLIIAVVSVLFRLIFAKRINDEQYSDDDAIQSVNQSIAQTINQPENKDVRHISRRDRSSRRGARVNFLHNYHDNLRSHVDEEDSADYVLYI